MSIYASIIQCVILIPCIVVFQSVFLSSQDAALTLFVSADEAKTNYSDSAAAASSLSQIQMNDTESIETIIAPPIDDEPSAAQPERESPNEQAALLLRSFFDDILELQTIYGSDLVNIQGELKLDVNCRLHSTFLALNW